MHGIPKNVSHTAKSSKSSPVETTFATANLLSLGENIVTRRRDPGLQISGRPCGIGPDFPFEWSAGHWLAGVPSKESK